MISIKLTKAEISHILTHLEQNELECIDGWYYGIKHQFEKRHKAIIKKLEELIK